MTSPGRILISHRLAVRILTVSAVAFWNISPAAAIDPVTTVERQPLAAATSRLLEALTTVGSPLPADDRAELESAMKHSNDMQAVLGIQQVLDQHVIAVVSINPESRVKVSEGPAVRELMQQGWRTFLVKVENEAGVTAPLIAESPNAAPLYQRGRINGRQRPSTDEDLVRPEDVPDRFLDIAMHDRQPLKPRLSGLALEYRIIQLYSRDAGRREAQLAFNVGQGTQDIGFRNSLPLLFNCVPAVEVTLGVKDHDGQPTTAAFVIRDTQGRVYPNPARRLAPDFFFHDQVYRADGETVRLPPGQYVVEVSRGPEYIVQKYPLTVHAERRTQRADFQLQRWIHPAARGWYSGDHHVHAAGCAHYDAPTEGVTPADMMRHFLGEDLNVGCVLTWGPCWYHQKQFFEGQTSALSRPGYLMRYDIEVSGFPSSHAGHLCLLRLKEDDYPGTTVLEDWPSWTLPVLKWGREQGGVVGYSHSGWGLQLPDHMPDGTREFPKTRWGGATPGWPGREARTLPDYAMPRFDGIGANEYIVTVTHDVCHFISAVDTPSIWELNVWYHTLNCGMRAVISGETDFPCIYGDRVGLGRVYVKLDPDQPLTFDNWILGVRDGRSYCGDGLSHILDFQVNGVSPGEPGPSGTLSQLEISEPGRVSVSFDAAALLQPQPNERTERIRSSRLDQKPYWHLERCRIGDSRKVPVELIVNGQPVATREIVADGRVVPVRFETEIARSSWIAVRILPSVHTNPVFVEVGGQPLRASRRSAQWCLDAVDVCWKSKQNAIRDSEKEAAARAYEHARSVYRQVMAESKVD